LSLLESRPRQYTPWRGFATYGDTDARQPQYSVLIIGALIVAVGVLGYSRYQTKKEPEGLQINVGPSALKV
jgi:hypothetical protein